MKIALITDTHWGVRNDQVAFLDNNKKFLDDIFFPYLNTHSIGTVIHLGDLVDRRKYLNINTAKRLRTDFLDPIQDRNLGFHILVGNHDTYFKNTNSVNVLQELLVDKYPDFKIYDNYAKVVKFAGTKIMMLPWICDENRDIILQQIGSTNAQICMGHLELAGFEMYRGSPVSHGDDRSLFGRFDMVLSGHYHHRSSAGNIHYLGSHAEFTWSDYDDPKGFHILDTETRELAFIENPFKMFRKMWYNDKDVTTEDLLDRDFSKYAGAYVKLIVQGKDNPFAFDLFTTKLYEANPIEVVIVEDHRNMDTIDENDLLNEAEDTITLLTKYIGTLETSVDTKELDNLMHSLYNEAMKMEV
jgi:DNA repair exonuclease SbcCD nuclease subunit